MFEGAFRSLSKGACESMLESVRGVLKVAFGAIWEGASESIWEGALKEYGRAPSGVPERASHSVKRASYSAGARLTFSDGRLRRPLLNVRRIS